MNIVFGCVGSSRCSAVSHRIKEYARETFGAKPEFIYGEAAASDSFLGYVYDKGSVMGIARDARRTLVYLGAIFAPCPGWQAADSPIDDPNATAAWLLDRYLAVGKTFLDGVNGQYSVVLFDPAADTLLLASDPFGGRSLFISVKDRQLLFSSNLRLLGEALADDLRLDRTYEDFFLIYGFHPFGRTVYQSVETQSPGEILLWQAGSIDRTKIDDSRTSENSLGSVPAVDTEEQAIEALYQTFLRATAAILPSKPCKVSVLLGGFDSALVASVIMRLGFDVETYSFFYDDQTFNQPHTDTLARHLGIRHHWVKIDRDIVERGLKSFSTIFNQPTNWPNYVIQTAHVCKRIRDDGISLCYSGDGCDAAFLGYPGTYHRARVIDALPGLSGAVHRTLLSLAEIPLAERWFGHPYRVFLGILRGMGRSPVSRGYLSFRVMDELTLRQLRRSTTNSESEPIESLIERLSTPHAELPVLRRAFLGKAAVSPNRSKLIASADASGVPILSPYLHPDLKKMALDLPVNLLRPDDGRASGATGKFILMRMAEVKELLPREVIYQPKVAAVDAPIDAWYSGPMRPLLRDLIDGLPFDYDRRYVDRLLDRKAAENLFKRFFMTDKVISHAASLLATYASFTRGIGNDFRPGQAPEAGSQCLQARV